MDIISLACLTGHLSQWVQTEQQVDHLQGMDYYGMGKMLCSRGKKEAAISFYCRALNCALPPPSRCSIYKELGAVYKSNGEWKAAIDVWKQVIDEDLPGNKFAFIELAKYYEHKAKEYDVAIHTIEKYLNQKQTRSKYQQLAAQDAEEEIKLRLKRLTEKKIKHG
jgi:tetratricopeptide (TPR) repeat protein